MNETMVRRLPFWEYFAIAFFTSIITAALAGVSTLLFHEYGYVLFVALPFLVGFIPALWTNDLEVHTLNASTKASVLALVFSALFFILFAIDGAICILMASPIALMLCLLGSLLGCGARAIFGSNTQKGSMTLLLIVLTPILMGAESAIPRKETVYPVQTSVVIDAPAQRVWDYVIAFPELEPPDEWMFRLGISYPTHAVIYEQDGGWMRECHFSTGAFMEPITNWDEPNLLQFEVSSQPDPMVELSPYNIHPPHFEESFLSKRGEFRLTPTEDGKIELAGTTWYALDLHPRWYWKLWTDAIIHRIHLRVLNHIKTLAEAETP